MEHDHAHDHAHAGGSSNAAAPPNIGAGFGEDDGFFSFNDLAGDVFSADKVYSTRFESLNNSGVSADALVLQEGNQLKVIVSAEGLEAGLHPLHIHGVPDGDSRNVVLSDDADADGFVEVLEGAPGYGPIVLNLLTDPDTALDVELGVIRADLPFPTVGSGDDGKLLYAQTFDFDSQGQFTGAILDEVMPLEDRHLVLHGQTVREGDGAGTPGEVDGSAGYKAALPVANGELAEVTDPFAKLVALANLMDDQHEIGAMASANADLAMSMA